MQYENNSKRFVYIINREIVGVIGVSLMCVCLLNFMMVMLSIQLFLLFVILLFPPLFMPLPYYLWCCHIFFLTHSHPLSKPLLTQIKQKMQSLHLFLLLDPFWATRLASGHQEVEENQLFYNRWKTSSATLAFEYLCWKTNVALSCANIASWSAG